MKKPISNDYSVMYWLQGWRFPWFFPPLGLAAEGGRALHGFLQIFHGCGADIFHVFLADGGPADGGLYLGKPRQAGGISAGKNNGAEQYYAAGVRTGKNAGQKQ